MKKQKEPADDRGIRMVGHRRISRTIHDHLIERGEKRNEVNRWKGDVEI